MSINITEILKEAGLLTKRNQEFVSYHPMPKNLSTACYLLHQAGRLTQDDFDLVLVHARPDNLASAMIDLLSVF